MKEKLMQENIQCVFMVGLFSETLDKISLLSLSTGTSQKAFVSSPSESLKTLNINQTLKLFSHTEQISNSNKDNNSHDPMLPRYHATMTVVVIGLILRSDLWP